MPPLISVRGRIVGAEKVSLKIGTGGQRVMDAVRKTVRQLGYELERIVKQDTLSGQVLHRRSGDGARSVNTRFVSGPTSETARVGTKKVYMRAWQLGFHVPERTIEAKNAQALFWPGARHPVKSVRQRARDVAARPFLTVGLNILRPRIGPRIHAAANAALRGEASPAAQHGA